MSQSEPAPRFGIVVPAKDPGDRFAQHLASVVKLRTPWTDRPVEIVVVDDGSVSDVVRVTCATMGVECVAHRANKGKGAALRTGFTALFDRGFSGEDVVGFIDADGDISASHLQAYAASLAIAPQEVVAVVGSKVEPGSCAVTPTWRRCASVVFSVYTSAVMPTGVRDTQVGAKVFRAAFLHDALPLTSNNRFLLDVELLAIAHRRGFGVKTAPVTLSITTATSTVGLRTAFDMSKELAQLSYKTHRGSCYATTVSQDNARDLPPADI